MQLVLWPSALARQYRCHVGRCQDLYPCGMLIAGKAGVMVRDSRCLLSQVSASTHIRLGRFLPFVMVRVMCLPPKCHSLAGNPTTLEVAAGPGPQGPAATMLHLISAFKGHASPDIIIQRLNSLADKAHLISAFKGSTHLLTRLNLFTDSRCKGST